MVKLFIIGINNRFCGMVNIGILSYCKGFKNETVFILICIQNSYIKEPEKLFRNRNFFIKN